MNVFQSADSEVTGIDYPAWVCGCCINTAVHLYYSQMFIAQLHRFVTPKPHQGVCISPHLFLFAGAVCVGTSSHLPSAPKRALPVGHSSAEPVLGACEMEVVSHSAQRLWGCFGDIRWELHVLTGLLWGGFWGVWLCRDVELFLAKAPACSPMYQDAAGVHAAAGFTVCCHCGSRHCLSPHGLLMLS